MAIISFCSNGKGETGKTASIAAITTYLAIQHNYKILILDTKYNDYSYQDCFWKEDKSIKLIHVDSGRTNIASGITGLSKAILSNKTSPEIITNYTKIVFRDRLEVLTEVNTERAEYDTHKKIFKDIAKIASKYYDLVFVDIDSNLDEYITNSILEVSDLIVTTLSQKIRHINDYITTKQENMIFQDKAVIPLLGRYDKNSKYSAKNIARYMKEKEGVCSIQYNTLFFEACNEGEVADFFIKLRKVSPKDKNALFIEEVKKTAERIVYKLQELQMRM